MIDLKNSEGVFCMTNAQFESEKEYQVRISLIKEMLKLGLITEKEYSKINTIFIEKYAPIFGTLYR